MNRGPGSQNVPDQPVYGVYVGHLPQSLLQTDIEAIFKDCRIKSVRMVRDRETDTFKGYCYVDFEDKDSFNKALRLDNALLEDSNIAVRPQNSDRGGRGGGRGGRGSGQRGDYRGGGRGGPRGGHRDNYGGSSMPQFGDGGGGGGGGGFNNQRQQSNFQGGFNDRPPHDNQRRYNNNYDNDGGPPRGNFQNDFGGGGSNNYRGGGGGGEFQQRGHYGGGGRGGFDQQGGGGGYRGGGGGMHRGGGGFMSRGGGQRDRQQQPREEFKFPDAEAVADRPKLNLQKRAVELPVGQLAETMQRDLIFGNAKPRDEAVRERLDSETSASARDAASTTAGVVDADHKQQRANAVAE